MDSGNLKLEKLNSIMLKPEDPACHEQTNQVSKTSILCGESRKLNQLITIKLETP